MRYEKLAASFIAVVKLAATRLWPQVNESTTESVWSQTIFRRLRKANQLSY